MMDIVNKILSLIGTKLPEILIQLLKTINNFFSWQEKRIDVKEEKQRKEEQKETQKTIEKVVDHGTLDDLLDLKKDKND